MFILLKRFKHSLLSPFNPYPAVKEYQATTVFLSSCSETTSAISKQPHVTYISTSAEPTKNTNPFPTISLCIHFPLFKSKSPAREAIIAVNVTEFGSNPYSLVSFPIMIITRNNCIPTFHISLRHFSFPKRIALRI
ncbi:hypothetical protein POPTR_003G210301v4 [Populus trichocarpa]|uniref:Uncharacterized protein n=1 Tax=Populus trichocarpa TaxID=3694 RepID=A0ACC0TBJ0_POPTR|nr:hypothetical protein BDE02_03G193000 [Populus trichocarpa]KAI9398674.1 hypothetical protein POPTR_003G210301v4 [Populus trichocarpa]